MKKGFVAILFLSVFLDSFSQNQNLREVLNDSLLREFQSLFINAEKKKDIDVLTDKIISLSDHYKRKSEYNLAALIITNYMNILPRYDETGKAKCLLQLGELNRSIEDSEEAIIILQDALQIFKKLNNTNEIGKVYNRIAAVRFEEKKFDIAKHYTDSSMIYALQNKDKLLIASNLEIQGAVLSSKEDYKNAVKLFLEVINIYNETDSVQDANIYINLCITYFKLENYSKSIYYGEKAYTIAKNQDISIYIRTVGDFLSGAYSKTGNYKRAYQYIRECYTVSDELCDKRRDIEILELNKKYINDKILLEISNQKARLEQKNKLNYLFGLLFLPLIVSLLFLIQIRKKTEKSNRLLHSKNNEITEQRKKIELQSDKIKQKAADLMVLNMQLKEVNSLKEGLTAMLVHDLKNPLNNILNISKQKEVISFANQMLVIVNNILDVQKYESDKMKLEIYDYNLANIIKEAVEQIIILAEHKNIKIIVEKGFDINVAVDFNIIQRVFVNLLTNSIKYTPNNGLIELKCEISRDNHSFVEISLKDNGIGIRKDKINTIFNKFNQIIAKDSGHARSTGLGLTFCKMAVEAHNGEINVISEPGVFTEFNFKIPVSDNVSVQNKQTIISDTVIKINLDKSEKEYLMNFIKDLEKTEVYDIGKLRILTKKIDDRFSKNINSWKKELNNSIYNCNFEYYNELIKTAKMNDDEA